MRKAFIETLVELAGRDSRIHLLTADLGYSVLEKFRDAYPDRCTNVGVAEQNLIGLAAGLALCGKTVFVYSIANFPTLRCFEQIRNDVCYHQADVKVVAVGGGLGYGAQGYTHHGVEDLAVMRALPGMTVTAPGDPVETRLVTKALAGHAGPAYLRLGKGNEPAVHQQIPSSFQLGKALPLRAGNDVVLMTTGNMLQETVRAADELAQRGVLAQVLSFPTVKPLDRAAVIAAALRTDAVVSVEEHSVTGGFGSAVADALAEAGVGCLFRKFGLPDEVHHKIGGQTYMRALAGNLVTSVEELLARRRRRHAA